MTTPTEALTNLEARDLALSGLSGREQDRLDAYLIGAMSYHFEPRVFAQMCVDARRYVKDGAAQ